VARFQYLLLLGACLAGTLPLELLLGVRVWRRPARLAKAVLPVTLAFSLWDVLAIRGRLWSYAPRYTTGWEVGFGLPIEELAFFVVIPICGILSVEAVRVRLGER
jgi:lycopene cyclase domain-containing protein